MDPTAISLTIGLVGGLVLGAVYYGGLALTTRWLQGTERAVVWAYVSFVVRLTVVAIGLVVVTHGDIGRMIAAGTGIFSIRALYSWVERHDRSPS